MGSTVAGVATIVALGFWYLRTRRHPNWRRSPDARFYVTAGYPLTAIAVYWLAQSSGTDWAWTVGNLWALAAMILFVHGFHALNQPTRHDSPPASANGNGNGSSNGSSNGNSNGNGHGRVPSRYSDTRGITAR